MTGLYKHINYQSVKLIVNNPICPTCQSNKNVTLYGTLLGKMTGTIYRYHACKVCEVWFRIPKESHIVTGREEGRRV